MTPPAADAAFDHALLMQGVFFKENGENMHKRVVSFFLVTVIFCLLAGCKTENPPGIGGDVDELLNSNPDEKEQIFIESLAAEAIDQLQEYYPDDDFTYVSKEYYNDILYGRNVHVLRFESKNYKKKHFSVYALIDDDDKNDLSKYRFYDLYYQYSL